jgi:hypothetical protein
MQMPLMPDSFGDFDDACGAYLYALTFMVHPSDDQKREELQAHALLKMSAYIGDAGALNADTLWNIVSGSARNVGKNPEEAATAGSMAGEVLLYVLRGHLWDHRDLGLDKAQHLTSEFFRSTHARNGTPYAPKGRGARRDTVLNAWTAFRPVAHLWAAWSVVNHTLNRSASAGFGEWLVDHSPEFLAIAHGLLLSASACRLPRSDACLIDRAAAWELAGIEPIAISLPDLDAADTSALKTFTPRFR